MEMVRKIETRLGELFKDTPKMSASAKESMAKAWPWIALVFGVLQLVVAYGLWRATRVVEALNDFANSLSIYTGTTAGFSTMDRSVMYFGVAVLVVDGVILLMAYPELVKRTRRGWELLFLGALLNTLYAVMTLFFANYGGVGSFVMNLVGSAAGFYLLFQVSEKYGHSAKK